LRFVIAREYQRRSLVDRKDLLVKIDRTGTKIVHDDDDDDDIRRLRDKQEQLRDEIRSFNVSDDDNDDDHINEQKLISTNDQSQTMLNFRQRYQNDAAIVPKPATMGDSSFDMMSDSSSSIADDETIRINELYANMSDQIDGKHRIKIKGDELKIKGRSSKQRPKLMDAQFFQSNDDQDQQISQFKPSAPTLVNSSLSHPINDADLASFDFLNEYDEQK
jgi:hypothetical protein